MSTANPSASDAADASLPIELYGNVSQGQNWIKRYRNFPAHLICTLAFTATGLLPNISAAGKTPRDRRYTALADAEFLVNGITGSPARYALPPLQDGLSPVLITRAIWENFNWPLTLFNAGLPETLSVPDINVNGVPARCVSTGQAMPRFQVRKLLNQGMHWGEQLSFKDTTRYLILGECVVGGTTTAMGVLQGLGYEAYGRVNSSHPVCNHKQKAAIVEEGLRKAKLPPNPDPLDVASAVGDPMQIFLAGLLLTASLQVGILLAGGTQMLAVYVLAAHLTHYYKIPWQPENILIGTTRWVIDDTSSATLDLLDHINERLGDNTLGACLAATQLNFESAKHPGLRAYEKGFVKEGVAAGGTAIAASVSGNWQQDDLLQAIESLVDRYG